MNLVDINDSLEIDLGASVAVNQLQVSVDFVEKATGGDTPGHQDSQSNGTTAVTILSAPGGASIYKIVQTINVYQKDTSEATITIQFNNNGTIRELVVATLSPGDTLRWSIDRGWKVDRAILSGRETNEASDTQRGIIELATAGDIREANNNTLVVTPGRIPYHPGTSNVWLKASGDGLTLDINFNVTSITDTGTGRLGVTIATDFVTPNYAIFCSLIRGVTTYAVADVEDNNIRFQSQLAGSFEIESFDHTATTMTADDPASYFGLCYGYWI